MAEADSKSIILERLPNINLLFANIFNLKYKEMKTKKLSMSTLFAEPVKQNFGH